MVHERSGKYPSRVGLPEVAQRAAALGLPVIMDRYAHHPAVSVGDVVRYEDYCFRIVREVSLEESQKWGNKVGLERSGAAVQCFEVESD